MTEVGCSWGGTRLVTCDFVLQCAMNVREYWAWAWDGTASRCNPGAAAEADASGDKSEKSNKQFNCDRTRGIAVDRQLPRIITFREDNSNVGTCPDLSSSPVRRVWFRD